MSVIRGVYKVVIAGQDVTSRFAPLLKSLTITRAAGETTDSANFVLADPNGKTFMPQDRASVEITLNGVWAFSGYVAEVSCEIAKDGGRQMTISASSADQGGKVKEPALRQKDDASLSDVAKEWGGKVGLNVQVIGSVSSVQRPYWIMQNESFMSWAQRTAREVGGTFKIIGDRAFIAARSEGVSASGRPLTPIPVRGGGNLKSGTITPIISRPKFGNVKLEYFDRAKGERVEVDVDTGVQGVDVTLRELITAADEEQAKQKAEAKGKESDREQGQGSVTIIGDPRAEPEAECSVSGFRPGVDGTYRIHSVTHKVGKSGGFETTLELRQPKGGAGVDSR
ncbi:phage late control D family protein [Hoeflea sp.]|uniref:phage late control D family protein n=1 Tax=Hoeflea sp. TaxID=1940281 RepID=UPI003B530135